MFSLKPHIYSSLISFFSCSFWYPSFFVSQNHNKGGRERSSVHLYICAPNERPHGLQSCTFHSTLQQKVFYLKVSILKLGDAFIRPRLLNWDHFSNKKIIIEFKSIGNKLQNIKRNVTISFCNSRHFYWKSTDVTMVKNRLLVIRLRHDTWNRVKHSIWIWVSLPNRLSHLNGLWIHIKFSSHNGSSLLKRYVMQWMQHRKRPPNTKNLPRRFFQSLL